MMITMIIIPGNEKSVRLGLDLTLSRTTNHCTWANA